MTTAIIVQARMKSNRLPGKVAQDLAGKPVLQHVLERCAKIPGADIVVCAMPDESESLPLLTIAAVSGAAVFRGSETDVLSRYAAAAQQVGATVIMRVTSDCPLIDPQVCGEVLSLRAQHGADYATNNMPPTFPHGLDCEATTLDALVEADRNATEAFDREHVTPWIRRASHIKRVNLASNAPAILTRHRWTLDYAEDLEFFRSFFPLLPSGSFRMADVLSVLDRHPEFLEINSKHLALERVAEGTVG